MADKIRVTGLDQLQKMLDTLPVKLEKNIMRGALRAGMKPIQDDAKSAAAVASGQLRDGLKISTSAKGGRVVAKLKATGPHAPVAHLVEYGTAAHKITARGRKALSFGGRFFQDVDHPGTRPRPFMRPALDARAQDAVVAVGEYVKQRLESKQGLDTSEITIETAP